MQTIRLSRTGRKHTPFYRIVVALKTKHVSKNYQEILGTYNPRTKEFNLSNEARLEYHIGLNTEMSDTVKALIKKHTKLIK